MFIGNHLISAERILYVLDGHQQTYIYMLQEVSSQGLK